MNSKLLLQSIIFFNFKLFNSQILNTPSQEQISLAETLADAYLIIPENRPKMVRFAFHTCVGPDGCNGCLNIDYSENKGLETIFTDLNMFYEQTTEFSRADFWALFAIRALRFVNPRDSNVKPENYTFGRIDCKTSPHETELHDYPNPRKGWSHVQEKFGPASTFNFNPEEIVALIGGAHSLGKMHPENSGFEKAWDTTEYVCDNYFLNFLISGDYEQLKNEYGNYQWTILSKSDKFGKNVAFNTDISLWKDIEIKNSAGELSNCQKDGRTLAHSCPNNEVTIDYFEKVATDPTKGLILWEDFQNVYWKMLQTGMRQDNSSDSKCVNNHIISLVIIFGSVFLKN